MAKSIEKQMRRQFKVLRRYVSDANECLDDAHEMLDGVEGELKQRLETHPMRQMLLSNILNFNNFITMLDDEIRRLKMIERGETSGEEK